MLEHPDDYARGKGRLQRAAIKKERLDLYEAAATYWGGGYDGTTDEIEEGPTGSTSVPPLGPRNASMPRSTAPAKPSTDSTGTPETHHPQRHNSALPTVLFAL